MNTPAARVAAYLRAAHVTHADGWAVTHTPQPLYLEDLAGVLERLREVCDDCTECPCGAWLCRSCDIGDPASCDDGFDHCNTFECLCRLCAIEAGNDERADRAYTAARGK